MRDARGARRRSEEETTDAHGSARMDAAYDPQAAVAEQRRARAVSGLPRSVPHSFPTDHAFGDPTTAKVSLVAVTVMAAALVCTRLAYSELGSWAPMKVTTWDAFGYYEYLPATFLHPDIER